jgi:hypothetical protein
METLYNELNNVFPNQWWFYEVQGLNYYEASDRCVRLTANPSHVVNYYGKLIFASVDKIPSDDIPWLVLIGGPAN